MAGEAAMGVVSRAVNHVLRLSNSILNSVLKAFTPVMIAVLTACVFFSSRAAMRVSNLFSTCCSWP